MSSCKWNNLPAFLTWYLLSTIYHLFSCLPGLFGIFQSSEVQLCLSGWWIPERVADETQLLYSQYIQNFITESFCKLDVEMENKPAKKCECTDGIFTCTWINYRFYCVTLLKKNIKTGNNILQHFHSCSCVPEDINNWLTSLSDPLNPFFFSHKYIRCLGEWLFPFLLTLVFFLF